MRLFSGKKNKSRGEAVALAKQIFSDSNAGAWHVKKFCFRLQTVGFETKRGAISYNSGQHSPLSAHGKLNHRVLLHFASAIVQATSPCRKNLPFFFLLSTLCSHPPPPPMCHLRGRPQSLGARGNYSSQKIPKEGGTGRSPPGEKMGVNQGRELQDKLLSWLAEESTGRRLELNQERGEGGEGEMCCLGGETLIKI